MFLDPKLLNVFAIHLGSDPVIVKKIINVLIVYFNNLLFEKIFKTFYTKIMAREERSELRR